MVLILNWIEILFLFIMILLSVAYLTIAERKTLAFMQRRIGPNIVGYYGQLMAIADALKLLLKEIILLRESNKFLIIVSPIIALTFALFSWVVIPFSPGIALDDIPYSLLFILVVSSVGVFGTLFIGWSSNSKYSLLASIRSTAQLISYELILTTDLILCFFLSNSLNISQFIDNQTIWFSFPLFPIALSYYIASLAETGRTPFDNLEAESELVSGHMTELSASPFVLFYLTEYNNIVLISYLNVILFFSGYKFFSFLIYPEFLFSDFISVLAINIKSLFLVFGFIWVRASFPRLRFDLLINLCWVVILPLLFAIILFIPNLLFIFDSFSLYN